MKAIRKRKEVRYPEPGIFGEKGKGWTVKPTRRGANINTKDKIISVPVDASARSRFLRSHEMAHIRYSPESNYIEGVPQNIVLAVEDLRINYILKSKNLIPEYKPYPVNMDLIKSSPLELLLFSCASAYQPEFSVAQEVRYEVDPEDLTNEVFHRVKNLIEDDPYSFESTTKAAKLIASLFDESDDSDERPDLQPLKRSLLCSLKDNKWGRMNLELPPLTIAQKGFLLKSTRATDDGFFLRSPERLLVDGKIFGLKRRIKGGTILIDASGSMSMSPQDVKKILDVAPNATVFIYGADDYEGECRRIAHGGRMVHPRYLSSPGGGNVIDGPCLKHISTMSKPRIWVSDGFVTGVHDSEAPNLSMEAMNLCVKHNIRRVDSAAEVPRFLKDLCG